ncbi:uncharacterized protein LOC122032025 isoform X1 [Zingiber officinale]|uniref:uncharacterized protein LOC122032025 isoform X1 n=1 Tax=Zingiber officinale TaxID=94328 RepID=UPI001C4D6A9E|nr:uncharacterized protein LOC122032025 isoform X1 [Zingiber officinale]
MASPTLDGASLFLVALLLPLRLLGLSSRLLRGGSDRVRSLGVRSVVLFAFVSIRLSAIFALSDTSPSERGALLSELEDLRLKASQLELVLEVSTRTFNSKILDLEERDKVVKEMEEKIRIMENALYELKGSNSDLLNTEVRIGALEKEIQLLFEQSAKNKDSIWSLELSNDKAKEKMEIVASEVEKIENIVTEQWIQIRQLEQAFQSTKMMAANVLKRNKQKEQNKILWPTKETVNKVVQFIRGIGRFEASEFNLLDSFFLRASFSKTDTPRAYDHFKAWILFAQNCHYELQDLIKHEMKMNEFTAEFANNFVVFYLASMMMAIPVMIAWIVFSSLFNFFKG